MSPVVRKLAQAIWWYVKVPVVASGETLFRLVSARGSFFSLSRVGDAWSGAGERMAGIVAGLGLAWVAVLATVCAACLSMCVAWLFGFVIDVPNYGVHIFLAFVIPFFVAPPFGYFMASSILDLHRARAHGRQLVEEAERERGYLQTAVNNMPIGLVMFDPGKRLIIGNDRYREMYGLPEDVTRRGTHLREMLERRLSIGSFEGGDREEYIERILKLVEQTETGVRVVELGDGRSVSIIHRPIRGGGWVGTHEDVTERQKLNSRLEQQNQLLKIKEEQLGRQNIQLDAAVNNMVQGLAMFDAENRLVLCNRRYAEIYGLDPEATRPGTTLKQVIENRLGKGLKSDKSADEIVDAMLHRRNGTKSDQFYSQLSDGRCIAIAVQPMADGGTVTTHQDITEQRQSEARIAHMAHHDALTGLANRVLLNERMGHALARVARGGVVAAHMLDLDRFKAVNDTLGHAAGDSLLKIVASRLRGITREADTIARMGGDEFSILQVAITQPADATALAQRVIDVLCEPYEIEGQQVVIGTSVGIAVGPADGSNPGQLIRNADLALYRAKADGGGSYHFFEPSMDVQMQERRAIETDLRKALGRGEFELYYQPVVNLESNQIQGFEALIRWCHPEKGMIAPAAFIPLAEEIGFIVPLGEWAIRQACTAAATWPDDLKVAVNLSPAQFHSSGLVQAVFSALATSGLAPERLELEITETVLLQDSEKTLAMLYQLRELGVGVSMDDFGTGYSSLSYLQKFPFDKIKIDRSFVKDITDGVGSLNIVRAVAAMAKGLGMATTAEGVETLEQLEAVRSEGCTEMQGFLFSKPLPASEIERIYLANLRSRKAAKALPAA